MNLFEKYPTIEVPVVLNPQTVRAMREQWVAIDHSKHRVVLLKGQPGIFCQGMDLHWVAHQEMKAGEIEAFSDFLKALMASSSITIAVVDGEVKGGGIGLAAACDFVAATPLSTFRLTEGMIGLVPGVILTALLNRLCRQTIKRMVFSAQEYRVEYALEVGLVDEVVAETELISTLKTLIKKVTTCKKQSVEDLKALFQKALKPDVDLAKEGALLLQYRLADAGMKNRLTCIANLMKSITKPYESRISPSSTH